MIDVLQKTLQTMYTDQYEWFCMTTVTQIDTLLSLIGKGGKEIRLRDSIRKYSLLYQYDIELNNPFIDHGIKMGQKDLSITLKMKLFLGVLMKFLLDVLS